MERKTLVVEKTRYFPIDVLRGLAVSLMIFANNMGDWDHVYPCMDHAPWIGFTLIDWVFPVFLFCMGFSMIFSLKKYDKLDSAFFKKILTRTVILYAIGILMRTIGGVCGKLTAGIPFGEALIQTLSSTRFYGVFPRLAICGFLCSILIVWCRKNTRCLLGISTALLVLYALLLAFGNGYEFSESNILYRVDHLIFSTKHLLSDTVNGVTLSFDPEGLLSNISCVAHVLNGYLIAELTFRQAEAKDRSLNLFISGFLMLALGWLLTPIIPIGKKMWSVTFVLVTCGINACLLALIIWLTDVLKHKRWFYFWNVLGNNALFMYAWSTCVYFVFQFLPLGRTANGVITIKNILMSCASVISFGNPYLASALYAAVFFLINWLFGWFLYRRKISIKL